MNQLNPLVFFSTCTGRCFEKEACGFAGEKSIMPHLLLKEQLFTHRRTSEVLKAYYLKSKLIKAFQLNWSSPPCLLIKASGCMSTFLATPH